MTWFREVLGVAVGGLSARKIRTLLIMLGPVLGAAGIVAAVGMNESAKGNVRATLERLGTNLIQANADGTFSAAGEAPTLPEDAVARAFNVSTVERAAGVTEVAGLTVTPSEGGAEFFRTIPVPVLTSDLDLASVLDLEMLHGRFLNQADEDNLLRSAVIGQDLSNDYQFLAGEIRTIQVDGINFAVVGVMRRAELVPDLDNAVIITKASAEDLFDVGPEPTTLYVRSADAAVDATAEALPVAINLGGPEGVTVAVPSDLLEAQGEVDRTLSFILAAMGLLALAIGGVGIANVMSISVTQRSGEIGIRRALGHTKGTIATQFLLEALFIGALGALGGVAVGVGAIYIVSEVKDWVATFSTFWLVLGGSAALGVSILAGIFPAWKAARLEPLETLRLG